MHREHKALNYNDLRRAGGGRKRLSKLAQRIGMVGHLFWMIWKKEHP